MQLLILVAAASLLSLQEQAALNRKDRNTHTSLMRGPQVLASLSGALGLPTTDSECSARHKTLSRRSRFFSRVDPPPAMSPQRFGHMLASSGINPRGVVSTRRANVWWCVIVCDGV
jgi:hypothetical protein